MTREEAKKINYMVGQIVENFNREFSVLDHPPNYNYVKPLISFSNRINNRLNTFRTDMVHIRNQIAKYLLENLNEE